MTKSEFAYQAGKANLYPELFGMILNCSFSGGMVPSGCEVDGIEWYDEYVTRSEYSCYRGTHEVTALQAQPYVVLKKNRKKYIVEAWRVRSYIDKQMRNRFFESAKVNNNTI